MKQCAKQKTVLQNKLWSRALNIQKQCVEQSSITGSDAIAVKRLQAVLRIKNGAEIKFCAVL